MVAEVVMAEAAVIMAEAAVVDQLLTPQTALFADSQRTG